MRTKYVNEAPLKATTAILIIIILYTRNIVLRDIDSSDVVIYAVL